jgi:predicted porin
MFKKSVMAAAVAAVVSAPAMAAEWKINEDTKMAVNVDLAAYYLEETTSSGTSEGEFDGYGLNQIEIKGSHKINDDVTVFGEIELDFDPIDDNSTAQTDDTKFGIKSKSFGTITVGQFDSYYEDKIAEAIIVKHGENAETTEMDSNSLDSRRIQYMNSVGDLTFAVDLSYAGDSNNAALADNTDTDIDLSAAALYKMGNLTLGAGFVNPAKYDNDGASTKGDGYGVVAHYKMDKTKLNFLYGQSSTSSNVDTDYMGASLVHKMGNAELSFGIQEVDADNAVSRTEMMAGIQYELYDDMHIWLDVAKLDKANDQGDVIEAGLKYSF